MILPLLYSWADLALGVPLQDKTRKGSWGMRTGIIWTQGAQVDQLNLVPFEGGWHYPTALQSSLK